MRSRPCPRKWLRMFSLSWLKRSIKSVSILTLQVVTLWLVTASFPVHAFAHRLKSWLCFASKVTAVSARPLDSEKRASMFQEERPFSYCYTVSTLATEKLQVYQFMTSDCFKSCIVHAFLQLDGGPSFVVTGQGDAPS